MIVIKGDNRHSRLISEYFKNAINPWNCNSETLYYGIDHGIVIAYHIHDLPKDVIILTYKDLEEL